MKDLLISTLSVFTLPVEPVKLRQRLISSHQKCLDAAALSSRQQAAYDEEERLVRTCRSLVNKQFAMTRKRRAYKAACHRRRESVSDGCPFAP